MNYIQKKVLERIPMHKFINSDNLSSFAYTNGELCKRDIKGVVLFWGDWVSP